jgi:glyoxylate/hydroxypyruvate reductase A
MGDPLPPVQATVAFASPLDDAGRWARALTAALPGLRFVDATTNPAPDDAEYALVFRARPDLFREMPRLKAIFALSAGVDAVLARPDLPAGVPVVRMIDPSQAQAMNQFALATCLAELRNLPAYADQQRDARWTRHPVRLAADLTVTVLGLGVLGRGMAEALASVGFRVAGWSRQPREVAGIACRHGAAGLADALAEADIVLSMLPLTAETHSLFDARTFARMKPGAVLVNLGRGEQVVEADLIAALDAGTPSAVWLDVFATEPLPPDHPYWRHPAIRITPHVAGTSRPETAAAAVVTNILRIHQGLSPLNAVDRQRGY